jgi:transcriptional regulator with XRE-family HTH domain
MDRRWLVPTGGQLVTNGREPDEVVDISTAALGSEPTPALHPAEADAGHPPHPLPRLAVLGHCLPQAHASGLLVRTNRRQSTTDGSDRPERRARNSEAFAAQSHRYAGRTAREALAARRRTLGLTQEALAARLDEVRGPGRGSTAVSTVARWERGESMPRPWQRQALAEALEVSADELARLLTDSRPVPADGWTTVQAPDVGDLEAIELVRRVQASDTGQATLEAIERAVDRLCRSYTSTPPADLLASLQTYRAYVGNLLDGRTTLAQRRQLMAFAGWLSLLTAIVDVDLHRRRAAAANLGAARTIGHELDHLELLAWAIEIEAWQALTDHHYDEAVALSRTGRQLAPADTSVHVQLAVQEARASARLGLARETHRLLDEAAGALDRMPPPDHPEHHFVFDPRKMVAYTATTLAWLGDNPPLAEEYARRAVAQYETAGDARWPRRLATTRIDLALVLARTGEPTEAAHLGALALDSGRLVPSNIWRVAELDQELTTRYGPLADVADFHAQYIDTRPQVLGVRPAGDG